MKTALRRTWPLALVAFLALGLAQHTPGQDTSTKAKLKVLIDPSAELLIDAYTTKQTGAIRYFITPPLPVGKEYQYKLTGTWNQDGKEVTKTITATVKAGEESVVDFGAGEVVAPPKKKVEEKKKDEPVKKKEPDPKKDDPKNVDPKKEDPKTVDPKKVDPKTVDPKTEPKKVPAASEREAKWRKFRFTYTGIVKGLTPGKMADVWVPIAVSSDQQEVAVVSKELPVEGTIQRDPVYDNAILHFQAKADENGQIPFQIGYKVIRNEVSTDAKAKLTIPARETPKLLNRFMQPDSRVPIMGKPMELLKDTKMPADPFAAAKTLYDVVEGHMKYGKDGKGWGQGDAVWACDSGFGNCTDFHSLFISLARGNKIPSKFEIGFPLPESRGAGPIGGYHCWAWFMPDGEGWMPVDISQADQQPTKREYYFGNLTPDRIAFTTGRDINMVPQQKGPALNYFIYPYVEVEGTPYPQENIETSFDYSDLPD